MAPSILSHIIPNLSNPTCIVCNSRIYGAYCEDTYGNKVCLHHRDQTILCLSCGKLSLKTASKPIGHEQYICPTCSHNSPPDKDIEAITQYVRKVLGDQGIHDIPSFTLHLAELSNLVKHSGKYCEVLPHIMVQNVIFTYLSIFPKPVMPAFLPMKCYICGNISIS